MSRGAMTALIEGDEPATWQALEARVAQVLDECGYDVEVQKKVPLARGDVNFDVWADDHSSPPNVIAVECKHWATAATKNVVHGFRTVVGDSGANTGLIVSTAGFQQGAVEAATYSNVRLTSWVEFQELFVERWYGCYMARRLREEADPLVEYTEPINSRIFRKADALDSERRKGFKALRDKYLGLGMGFMPMYMEMPGRTEGPTLPVLPLRDAMIEKYVDYVPATVLDATALRRLLAALTEAYRGAIAEFDQVFGGRA
jgi:restriction system protein